MIVSERHRYVFIQIPQSASTAIGNELTKYYGGRSILHKHATYHHFKNWAGPEADNFFCFASIRNPLETLVSAYYKLRTDHKGTFTDPATWKRHGGWKSDRELKRYRYIRDNVASFERFFKRFYWYPYVDLGVLNSKYCKFVVRYESLQQDFSRVLDLLGLTQVRELPRVNPTNRPAVPVLHHYPAGRRVCWVMGPILHYWQYEVPPEWKCRGDMVAARVAFKVVRVLKRVYFQYIV